MVKSRRFQSLENKERWGVGGDDGGGEETLKDVKTVKNVLRAFWCMGEINANMKVGRKTWKEGISLRPSRRCEDSAQLYVKVVE